MRIRGERECKQCGTRWSYYETGSVTCPTCDSIRSVGVDERTQHTDSPVEFDLTPVRNVVDAEPLHRVAGRAKLSAREYVRGRGFVRGGDLRPLDDEYLAAAELAHAADVFERSYAPTDDEQYYLLELLRGADAGERPSPGDVPDSIREARGLALAEAVRTYRREVRDWEGYDGDLDAELERLDDHARRIEMLQGDVAPREAERLVTVARELGAYLVDGDEGALVRARDRLDRLSVE